MSGLRGGHTLIGWLHRRLGLALRLVLLLGLAGAIYERQWLTAVVTAGILGLTLLPVILGSRFQVRIPAEFELLAILFIFASLFLGEVQGYYLRFWWWDVLLHTASGFLLGVLGFLLVYVLNSEPHIQLHMRPGFVALFSFAFAVTAGALWEIFEYAMDSLLRTNMQKSGLVDTMWDLIVDAAGALIVSIIGYVYLRTGVESFLARWTAAFIEANPRLFRRHRG